MRRKRLKPGVTGRPSLGRAEWNALKRRLWERARGRCEACRRATGLEPHHVVKRSAGGADALGNLVALCRSCHEQTDASYLDGRLVVEMQDGRPRFRTAYGKDKFTVRTASASTTEPSEESDEE